MINPATDCQSDLGPNDWQKMNRWQLEMYALHGNCLQKDSLIDWGYSSIPAWQFEDLYFMAKGQEWQQD